MYSPTRPRPEATTSNTVPRASCGTSCSSQAILMPGSISTTPSSGLIWPLMIFSRVDLPVPLRPTRQMRSPLSRLREAPDSSCGPPKARCRSRSRIRGMSGISQQDKGALAQDFAAAPVAGEADQHAKQGRHYYPDPERRGIGQAENLPVHAKPCQFAAARRHDSRQKTDGEEFAPLLQPQLATG